MAEEVEQALPALGQVRIRKGLADGRGPTLGVYVWVGDVWEPTLDRLHQPEAASELRRNLRRIVRYLLAGGIERAYERAYAQEVGGPADAA